MCGIAGFVGTDGLPCESRALIERMLSKITHRGPDSGGVFSEDGVTIGFRRLSLVDLEGGHQPLYNEDRSIVLVCNGEIYNYLELREELSAQGYKFSTRSDIEVMVHLYERDGLDFVRRLNGQFAFALYDRKEKQLVLGRDHAGIAPMYFSRQQSGLVFGSEVKAILAHGSAQAAVDLVGLDHVLCFPGVVSPRTMFQGVEALKPGSMIVWKAGNIERIKYWDFDFLRNNESASLGTSEYTNQLRTLFERAVLRRLQADVPVGIYLSGGLDSSMIACMAARLTGTRLPTFSITFEDSAISEAKYQRLVARAIRSEHQEIQFTQWNLLDNLRAVIYHSECPVKETYNTCSFVLSGFTRRAGLKAILTGEGADELFAGYPGYKFAALQSSKSAEVAPAEKVMREQLWGINIGYEKTYSEYAKSRLPLYSARARERLAHDSALSMRIVDPDSLAGRNSVHQRAYLDCKLRLADHLLTEHGDRMLLANSVEGRFPFLDQDFVDFALKIPPELKLAGFNEKFILKQMAQDFVPHPIVQREKYGFHAPGSPWLLRHGGEWIRELLAPERIRKQGYFDADHVEKLIDAYSRPGFSLDARMEDDLLMVVISFNIFLEVFALPDL